MTTKAKKYNIKVDGSESWQFLVTLRTYDTKKNQAVPWNTVNMFTVMEIYDVDGATLASASTDASDEVMARYLSGQAIMNFPLSATTGIANGAHNYKLYIADLPYLSSATYVKKVSEGSFEVE